MATTNNINNTVPSLTVNGNLVVTAGTISTSASSISAALGLTASNGNITATSGDVVVSNGNVILSASNATVGQIISGSTIVASTPGTYNLFLGGAGNTTFTHASNNVCIGSGACAALVGTSVGNASYNCAAGQSCLSLLTDGSYNCAVGSGAAVTTTGNYNCMFGNGSGSPYPSTGSYNCFFGASSTSYAAGDSSNIYIGYYVHPGAAESNTLRIGNATGTAPGQINIAYIGGIYGKAYGGATPVLINSSSLLGTTTSNRDSKDNIAPIGDDSSVIYKMQPVTFAFIQDPDPKPKQYGLIAQDIEPICPEMVNYDLDGKPAALYYNFLVPMLISEFQKLAKRIAVLEAKLGGSNGNE